MIRDRGLKKWKGFFMPEHISMLNKCYVDGKKLKKPVIDEQEFEEIGVIVMESLNYLVQIKLTVWQEGYFKYHSGVVSKVDQLMKYILLEIEGRNERIMIGNITGAERI
ncbi:YolD-like family protein [Cytobacillus depressus]|uniref:YolD-like family protein n=1 Tax=Cytobacillus depressus TaxID=1602942 RepID=A0A6L3V8B5_9BACI|nr:YolD-like family protein [Cytobacillus depressus]KAB2337667.1 YolD-like family protein [Cytobacillus depressus]